MSRMNKRNPTWQLERRIVGVLTGVALILACYAALSRYFFPQFAQGWIDELIIYVVVWSLWLSGGMLVSERGHVQADILQKFIKPALAVQLTLITSALGFAFCAIMTYGGIMVVLLSVRLSEHGDSTLTLPVSFYYAGFPVGMALMGWRYFQQVFEITRCEKDLAESRTGL